jgi:hypothetical protein
MSTPLLRHLRDKTRPPFCKAQARWAGMHHRRHSFLISPAPLQINARSHLWQNQNCWALPFHLLATNRALHNQSMIAWKPRSLRSHNTGNQLRARADENDSHSPRNLRRLHRRHRPALSTPPRGHLQGRHPVDICSAGTLRGPAGRAGRVSATSGRATRSSQSAEPCASALTPTRWPSWQPCPARSEVHHELWNEVPRKRAATRNRGEDGTR